MQFQQDWPKDKKIQLFIFFGVKLRKFRNKVIDYERNRVIDYERNSVID